MKATMVLNRLLVSVLICSRSLATRSLRTREIKEAFRMPGELDDTDAGMLWVQVRTIVVRICLHLPTHACPEFLFNEPVLLKLSA